MFQRDTQPSRRTQMNQMLAMAARRQKRGVPTFPETVDYTYTDEDGNEVTDTRPLPDSVKRQMCVEAGMPPQCNDSQMANWISGAKLRGPGITRKASSTRKAA